MLRHSTTPPEVSGIALIVGCSGSLGCSIAALAGEDGVVAQIENIGAGALRVGEQKVESALKCQIGKLVFDRFLKSPSLDAHRRADPRSGLEATFDI